RKPARTSGSPAPSRRGSTIAKPRKRRPAQARGISIHEPRRRPVKTGAVHLAGPTSRTVQLPFRARHTRAHPAANAGEADLDRGRRNGPPAPRTNLRMRTEQLGAPRKNVLGSRG